jgi:hypothetical protein
MNATYGGLSSYRPFGGISVMTLQNSIRRPIDLMGNPTNSAWREEALSRAAALFTLLRWLEGDSPLENRGPLVDAVEAHLEAARQGAHGRGQLRASFSGAVFERTTANLDAAEAHLLRLAPPDYLRSNMSNLLRQAQSNLEPDDPRYARLQYLAAQADMRNLSHEERNYVVAAIEGSSEEGRRAKMRVRGFRNVILFTAILMGVLAIIVAITGYFRPDFLPLCFEPDGTIVCPTAQTSLDASVPGGQPSPAPSQEDIDDAIDRTAGKWDTALVEFVGLLGATIAAAAALRRVRGTSDPYGLPVALAVLKVTTGALTAFLGILLIRAQFIPGLSDLDTSAQIVAWAIVLGYAQQLFTRAVDQQAQNLVAQTTSAPPRTAPAPQETMLQPQQGAAPAPSTTQMATSTSQSQEGAAALPAPEATNP